MPKTQSSTPVELSPLQYGLASKTPIASTHPGKRSLVSLDSVPLWGDREVSVQRDVVQLFDHSKGVFLVKIVDPINQNGLSEAVVAGLEQSFRAIQDEMECKVVLLTGDNPFFLSGAPNKNNALTRERITQLIKDCDLPIIAVMKGHSMGLGLLVGMLCDFVICSGESLYQYHDSNSEWVPSFDESSLFVERFGKDVGSILLSSLKPYSGSELKHKGIKLPVLAHDEVDSYAVKMAYDLASSTKDSLVELKRHLSQSVGRENGNPSNALASSPEIKVNTGFPGNGEINNMGGQNRGNGDGVPKFTDPVAIKIVSEVVKVEIYENGIVCVTLCDKINKNTFSQALVQGVMEAFDHIRENPEYKVVVLTGYDHYFACGGTREGLLAIQQGTVRFNGCKDLQFTLGMRDSCRCCHARSRYRRRMVNGTVL